jgi:hypothetical protein
MTSLKMRAAACDDHPLAKAQRRDGESYRCNRTLDAFGDGVGRTKIKPSPAPVAPTSAAAAADLDIPASLRRAPKDAVTS